MSYSLPICAIDHQPLLPSIDFEALATDEVGDTIFNWSGSPKLCATDTPIGSDCELADQYFSFSNSPHPADDELATEFWNIAPLDFSMLPTPETQYGTFNLEYENQLLNQKLHPFDIKVAQTSCMGLGINPASLQTPPPNHLLPGPLFTMIPPKKIPTRRKIAKYWPPSYLDESEDEFRAYTVLKKQEEDQSNYQTRTAYMEAIATDLRSWKLELTTLALYRIEKLRGYLNRGCRELNTIASQVVRLLFVKRGLKCFFTEENRLRIGTWPHCVKFAIPRRLRRWENLILITWCLLNPNLHMSDLQQACYKVLPGTAVWEHIGRIRMMYRQCEDPSFQSLRATGDSVNQVSVSNRSMGSLSADLGNSGAPKGCSFVPEGNSRSQGTEVSSGDESSDGARDDSPDGSTHTGSESATVDGVSAKDEHRLATSCAAGA